MDNPKKSPARVDAVVLFFVVAAPAIGFAVVLSKGVSGGSVHGEASGFGALRTITEAQVSYSQNHPKKGFAVSLSDLGSAGDDLIDSTLASGTKSGYLFTLTASTPDAEGRVQHYTLSARPESRIGYAHRSFFTDETRIIRSTKEDRAATFKDAALE
jgi:hypothetical protein